MPRGRSSVSCWLTGSVTPPRPVLQILGPQTRTRCLRRASLLEQSPFLSHLCVLIMQRSFFFFPFPKCNAFFWAIAVILYNQNKSPQ